MPITRTYYKVHRCFPDPDYFYLENTYAGSNTLTITKTGTPASTDLSYSLDKSTWTDIHNGGTVTVPQNGKVYLRSSTGFSVGESNRYSICLTYKFDAGGHIASLFDYNNMKTFTAIPDYGCYSMFFEQPLEHFNVDFSGITTIGEVGLCQMFTHCTSLITLPDFSGITTVGMNGLKYLCDRCTSLVNGVDLSGLMNIGFWGCSYMYSGCSSLNDAIAPNVSSWNTSHMGNWLNNTASTGVVRKPAGLTIPTDSTSGVPTGWTTEDY